METLINGQRTDSIPITDRGLLYGDGLFETVAVQEGIPRLWAGHMHRLQEGCRRLQLSFPDPEQLRAEVKLATGIATSAVAKIMITRGHGTRGYRADPAANHTRIVIGLPWPEMPATAPQGGVTVRWCDTRLARQPHLAGLKHLNRLEQVLARSEWQDDYAEGLMRDTEGWVIEGTMSNLFLVHRTALLTPDLSQCGVAGVVRAAVLEYAERLDIPVSVGPVTTAMVEEADSLFLTNSLIGLWPVARLGTRNYEVAHEITQTLQAALQRFDDRLA